MTVDLQDLIRAVIHHNVSSGCSPVSSHQNTPGEFKTKDRGGNSFLKFGAIAKPRRDLAHQPSLLQNSQEIAGRRARYVRSIHATRRSAADTAWTDSGPPCAS